MINTPIPQSLQPVLWNVDVSNLDIEKDKAYIVHQLLAYGDIDEIKWALSTYSRDELKRTFCEKPYKDYRPSRFYFITNYVLGLDSESIDSSHYVKNTPRHTGL